MRLLFSLPVPGDQPALSVAAIFSSFPKIFINVSFMTRKSYSPHLRAGQGYGGKEMVIGRKNKRGRRREDGQHSWVPFNVQRGTSGWASLLTCFQ